MSVISPAVQQTWNDEIDLVVHCEPDDLFGRLAIDDGSGNLEAGALESRG